MSGGISLGGEAASSAISKGIIRGNPKFNLPDILGRDEQYLQGIDAQADLSKSFSEHIIQLSSSPIREKWSRDRVIEEIQAIAKGIKEGNPAIREGKTIEQLSSRYIQGNYLKLFWAADYYFLSWATAVIKAGIPYFEKVVKNLNWVKLRKALPPENISLTHPDKFVKADVDSLLKHIQFGVSVLKNIRANKDERESITEKVEQEALERVERILSRNGNRGTVRRLIDLVLGLSGPAKALTLNELESYLVNFLDNRITQDKSQDMAVRLALNPKDEVVLIHGPAGAGKTAVIAEISRQFAGQGKRVLITTYTNEALDNALDAIVKMDETTPVARAASKAESITKDTRRPEIVHSPSDLNRFMREQGSQGPIVGATHIGLETVWGLRETEIEFDVVIFDEASQTSLPAGLVALLRAKEKAIFVGDHKQLPCVGLDNKDRERVINLFPYERHKEVKKEIDEIFVNSLFDSLINKAVFSRVMLTTNYRSHWAIVKLISELFYEDRLAAERQDEVVRSDTFKVIDTSKEEDHKEDPIGYSYRNKKEAGIVVGEVKRLLQEGVLPAEIGVISFYKVQVDYLKKKIREEVGDEISREIQVATVDSFQGKEKGAIILSATRSNDFAGVGFLNDKRRLNVALSRAKDRFILIGDMATLTKQSNSNSVAHIFKRIGEYTEELKVNGSSPIFEAGQGVSSAVSKENDLGQCVTADTLLPIISTKETPNSKSLPAKSGSRLASLSGKITNKSQFQNSNGLTPLTIGAERSRSANDQKIELKPIIDVKPGDYVFSLNEATQTIEPHRINGLLDMGVKPVYKLTTASGRSIKTTENHPYLTRKGWIKVSELKAGDEVAVARDDSSAAVGVFAGVDPLNNNAVSFNIKTDTVFSNPKSMSGWRQVNQWPCKRQGVSSGNIQLNLFNDSFLQLDSQIIEFPCPGRSELNFFRHWLNQDSPSPCLIFSKGTKPSLSASLIPFLSLAANLGFIGRCDSMASISQPTGLRKTYSLVETFSSYLASKAQRRSHRAYVSNIKYLGEPFLSTTTAALKASGADVLSSLGIDANFPNGSNLTSSFIESFINDLGFILISSLKQLKYNTPYFSLSRLFSMPEAEAAQGTDTITPESGILWDKIVSIEPLGAEHVYDIEVEGTHNFVANGIIAHNTYVGVESASPISKPPQGLPEELSNYAEGLYSRIRALSREELQAFQLKDNSVIPSIAGMRLNLGYYLSGLVAAYPRSGRSVDGAAVRALIDLKDPSNALLMVYHQGGLFFQSIGKYKNRFAY
jgi:hypothetical protein